MIDACHATARFELDRIAGHVAEAIAHGELLRPHVEGAERDALVLWLVDLNRIGRGVDALRALIGRRS